VSGKSLEGTAQVQDGPKMDWQEIRWLAVAIVAVLLIVQAPYALAFLTAPPDYAFSGTVLMSYLQDANSYLAKIRQGTAGNWLFYDLNTPEPHRPGPLFLLYIAWGKVGAVLGISPPVTLAIARLVHGFLLLATLYWFLALFLSKRSQRQTAFLLLAFSSGLGWLLVPFGKATVLGDVTPDFWMPEVSTFLTIFTFPHFAAATSLMLLTFIGWHLALRDESIAPALGAALSAFLLAWIHPFLLLPVYAVTAAYLAWQWFRHGEVPWRGVGTLMLCVLVSLPVVAYIQFGVIAPNPVFQGWMDQSPHPSPNVLAYLLGFGLLVPLALTGAFQAISRQKRLDPLPLLWLSLIHI